MPSTTTTGPFVMARTLTLAAAGGSTSGWPPKRGCRTLRRGIISRHAQRRVRMAGCFMSTIARCPLAPELDSSPLRASVKDRLLHTAIPLARAYVRYTPFDRSRDRLWTNWVEPYLAWHRHRFEARTQFGPRIAGDTFEGL